MSSRTDPSSRSLFDLSGRVAIVAGGAGLLGPKHAAAIASAGGIPVIVDLRLDAAEAVARDLRDRYHVDAWASQTDITRQEEVEDLHARTVARYGAIDILINNAANNPKV